MRPRFARFSSRYRHYLENAPSDVSVPDSEIVTKFYDRVLRIEAVKGHDSHFAGDKFYHDFKIKDAEVFGLEDGSVLIRSASGKKLWDIFEYD